MTRQDCMMTSSSRSAAVMMMSSCALGLGQNSCKQLHPADSNAGLRCWVAIVSPLTSSKCIRHCLATARTTTLFPHPGGPDTSTLEGGQFELKQRDKCDSDPLYRSWATQLHSGRRLTFHVAFRPERVCQHRAAEVSVIKQES